MLFVHHRVNSLSKLKEIEKNYGVEIDIRSWNSNLVLNHEALENGQSFKKWINECKSPLVILNIKSEGLEEEILEKIQDAGFEGDYFFLDQSFPFLVRTLSAGFTKTAVRVSEYESADYLPRLNNKWVWLDSHTGDWSFLPRALTLSKANGKKTCLASPELHSRDPHQEITEIKNVLNELKFELDAVCTKSPEIWN
jgi:hypothetical protein